MEKSELLKIAKKVRSNLEKVVDNIRKHFDELDMDEHDKETLQGFSVLAAVSLAKAFSQEGVDAQVKLGQFEKTVHCWVEVGGEIWDLTATQFDIKEKVLVSDKESKTGKEYLKGKKLDLRKLKNQFKEWPIECQPHTFLVNEIIP